MTEREIAKHVDRMLDHLNRLMLNRDMSEDDYHAAILELAEWEEAEMIKLRVRDEV
jgi:branched-subunit amino acid aminotransferase/4-amino-4-deoxychorismate lyase